MRGAIYALIYRICALALIGTGFFAITARTWSDGALLFILALLAGLAADIIEIKERLK